MSRNAPADEAPKGAPMWIVTFTDMISLLLTFFIMLLTFSSMEEEKFKQATGSLQGAFGVLMEGRRSRPDTAKTNRVHFRKTDHDGTTDPSDRRDEVEDAITAIQARDIFNVEISRADMIEGTRLEIRPRPGSELFELGTDRPTDWTRQTPTEIGRMFKSRRCRVVVEAHVDALTWKVRRHASADALTRAMAQRAAEILVEAGMIPELVGSAPMGSAHPVASNDEPEGRYANRRLDILVIPHEKDPLFARAGSR